jgi:hypothetical protein
VTISAGFNQQITGLADQATCVLLMDDQLIHIPDSPEHQFEMGDLLFSPCSSLLAVAECMKGLLGFLQTSFQFLNL